MGFKLSHTEVHVLDLEASLAFYERALDLHPVREKGPEDGSWKLVFLSNDEADHELELTWNRGRGSRTTTAVAISISRSRSMTWMPPMPCMRRWA